MPHSQTRMPARSARSRQIGTTYASRTARLRRTYFDSLALVVQDRVVRLGLVIVVLAHHVNYPLPEEGKQGVPGEEGLPFSVPLQRVSPHWMHCGYGSGNHKRMRGYFRRARYGTRCLGEIPGTSSQGRGISCSAHQGIHPLRQEQGIYAGPSAKPENPELPEGVPSAATIRALRRLSPPLDSTSDPFVIKQERTRWASSSLLSSLIQSFMSNT
ncbi:MAG: hypothetical protein METHP_00025 [Methanoregula sp. SKADARSKE-2]|nr:MAG: hypothetical protein METHP_00025 [Methanoregula sp. SKADARSKE-2]